MKQHARFTHRGKYASAWGEGGTGEGHEGVRGGCECRSSITAKAQCDRYAGVKCIQTLAMEHGVKPASGSDYGATTSRELGIEETAKHRAWAYRERDVPLGLSSPGLTVMNDGVRARANV